MKREEQIKIDFTKFDELEDLSQLDKKLCDAALNISKNAYAVYSNFYVGAAIRTSDGKIYTGNNQENSAYPSGLCAERVALFYLKSQEPDAVIETIAITARSEEFNLEEVVSPCGACRQVIAEYQKQQPDRPIKVVLFTKQGKGMIINNADLLLPFVFNELRLRKG